MQTAIPIEEIISLFTANLVLAALALSVVGATVAVCVRHWTSQNWMPNIQDIWYFGLSAGISVFMAIMGFDSASILTATTGVNTPLALMKTTMDKYSERKENKTISENQEKIKALTAEMEKLKAK